MKSKFSIRTESLEFSVDQLLMNAKQVWLIEYDDGNQSVSDKNAEDLTEKVTQYFDPFERSYRTCLDE